MKKTNLIYYIMYAYLGIHAFIYLALPFGSVETSIYGWNLSTIYTGYDLLTYWSGFTGIMASLFLLLSLLCAITLLVTSVFGILTVYNKIDQSFMKNGKLNLIAEIVVLSNIVFNLLTILFVAIDATLTVGLGLIFITILTIIMYFVLFLLQRMNKIDSFLFDADEMQKRKTARKERNEKRTQKAQEKKLSKEQSAKTKPLKIKEEGKKEPIETETENETPVVVKNKKNKVVVKK